jgi:hypothetical protein
MSKKPNREFPMWLILPITGCMIIGAGKLGGMFADSFFYGGAL